MSKEKVNPCIKIDIRLFEINPAIIPWFLRELMQESQEDDILLANRGLRYSPKAIRTLTFVLSSACEIPPDEKKHKMPNPQQYVENLLIYAYSLGFISGLELWLEQKGLPFIGNFSESPPSQWIGRHPNSSTKILSSSETAAAELNTIRAEDPSAKVVLFHGKWNVLHPGHMLFLQNSLLHISQQYEIPFSSLKALVVGERNAYIESVNVRPFLTTMWRLSLLSYLPNIFAVCPGGDITFQQASEYWTSTYRLLQPDFLPVEQGDPITPLKKDQTHSTNIEVVEVPSFLSDSGSDNRISSTKLLKEGRISQDEFERQCAEFRKQIGNRWRRKWF